jgi:hypothetical protein
MATGRPRVAIGLESCANSEALGRLSKRIVIAARVLRIALPSLTYRAFHEKWRYPGFHSTCQGQIHSFSGM